MNQANSSNQVFIQKLTEIILSNLEKENFCVTELADAVKESFEFKVQSLKQPTRFKIF